MVRRKPAKFLKKQKKCIFVWRCFQSIRESRGVISNIRTFLEHSRTTISTVSPQVLVNGNEPVVEGRPAESETHEGADDAPDHVAEGAVAVAGEAQDDLAGLVAEEHLEDRRKAAWIRGEGIKGLRMNEKVAWLNKIQRT